MDFKFLPKWIFTIFFCKFWKLIPIIFKIFKNCQLAQFFFKKLQLGFSKFLKLQIGPYFLNFKLYQNILKFIKVVQEY